METTFIIGNEPEKAHSDGEQKTRPLNQRLQVSVGMVNQFSDCASFLDGSF